MSETEQKELTGVELEIDMIQRLVADLEQMLGMWHHDGLDKAGWGELSNHWNQRRHEVGKRIAACLESNVAHRRAHLALAHLFDAWQRIHYTITRGRPADVSGLEEVKRRLAEAVAAGKGTPGKRATDQ